MKQNKTTQERPTAHFGGFFCIRSPRSWRRGLVLLPTLLALLACAPKHRPVPKATLVLPVKCIIGATIESQCRQVNAEYAVCDGIIVRYACVAPAPKP